MERYKVYNLSFFDQISRHWSSCVLCDQPSGRHIDLCHHCETSLPWLENPCPRCAYPRLAGQTDCAECAKHQPLQQQAQSLFSYEFPTNRLIGAFKFQRRFAYGKVLAELLAFQLIHTRPCDEWPQALIPIPLHQRRQRDRGYNQAQLIATWLARRLKLPVLDRVLKKPHATREQASLDRAARANNLQHAFLLRHAGSLPAHVALVDDVYTTGATARAAVSVLQSAGVNRVEIWTLARSL